MERNALRRIVLLLTSVIMTVGVGGANAPDTLAGLCQADETPIFQCAIGSNRLSLCAAEPLTRGAIQYRFGLPGKIELQYPAAMGGKSNTMRYAMAGYSGGGEAQVQFDTGGVRYVVYSRMVRTGFGPDGLHYPKDELGVASYRGDELLADQRCNGARIAGGKDDWIDEALTARLLPRTEEVVAVGR